MTIEHIKYENKGLFKAIVDEKIAGKMTYSWAGKDKFIIDHTEVNPAFKGQSIGNKMVMEAVAFARENNLKIIPLCPFAKSVFEKNQSINDVI